MSSVATTRFSTTRVPPSLLREIRSSYRRVCVLRTGGRDREADDLLAGKVSVLVTRALEGGQTSAEEIEQLFTREEQRVEEAHALAELLLPLLTAGLGAVEHRERDQSFSRSTDEIPNGIRTSSASPFPEKPPAAANEAAGTSPLLPGIADFIDEMLTQERATQTQNAATFRRPA